MRLPFVSRWKYENALTQLDACHEASVRLRDEHHEEWERRGLAEDRLERMRGRAQEASTVLNGLLKLLEREAGEVTLVGDRQTVVIDTSPLRSTGLVYQEIRNALNYLP